MLLCGSCGWTLSASRFLFQFAELKKFGSFGAVLDPRKGAYLLSVVGWLTFEKSATPNRAKNVGFVNASRKLSQHGKRGFSRSALYLYNSGSFHIGVYSNTGRKGTQMSTLD